MKKIAVFASGRGTNTRKIIHSFKDDPEVEIALVASNKADAPVLQLARENGIYTLAFNRKDFFDTEVVLDMLILLKIDLIVLAGFLWLVPKKIIRAFPHRIINIHPALLPKYGGKGMYGNHVHEAVLAAGEKESGISIHYLNEKYDEGEIIFQTHCSVEANDTPETLAQKIHQLEYKHFSPVIRKVISKL